MRSLPRTTIGLQLGGAYFLDASSNHFRFIVVGAGAGGLYAVHRFRQDGHTVLGLEAAADVGGVWYHNAYPGARVDLDSLEYCYHFSPELYRDWRWSERYASQAELLAYLGHVADRFDLRRHFRFNTRMISARLDPSRRTWQVTDSNSGQYSCDFLVMATGNLSHPRKPDFPGLDDFEGEWLQTANWPHREVRLEGRRVAVIGTGSSGVQTVPAVAEQADHLFVFQRTPNFVVPARNGPLDEARYAMWIERGDKMREDLLQTPSGWRRSIGTPPSALELSREECTRILEEQWNRGGQNMTTLFADQRTTEEANRIVSDFVRGKIREVVKDPEIAQALTPMDHLIGTRRLILDNGYYECFNRDNVSLVNIRKEPIQRIVKDGITTSAGKYKVDLIIFALGFVAFTGALDAAGIRNEQGEAPSQHWQAGPRAYLGLMTDKFPNLFLLTGPGSPSVLSNMILSNEQHVDWIADLVSWMDEAGYSTVEPTEDAVTGWSEHVNAIAGRLLRARTKNYMVHVDAAGNLGKFIPYSGGVDRYTRELTDITGRFYEGFVFSRGVDGGGQPAPIGDLATSGSA